MQEEENTSIPEDINLLVKNAVAGDAEVFGRLYDMYVERVYRHIFYRVGIVEDAEDLTQQVFMKAWKAIGRYKQTSSPFLAWLMRISHNLIIDFYRSRKDKVYFDTELAADDPDSSPERVAEVNFDQQRIRKAIVQLPGEQQRVIVMSFIEGFTCAEIASSMGKSEGAIRVIQHRALKKMRCIIEEGEYLD